jgi:predicted ATPase
MLVRFGEYELDDQRLTLVGPAGHVHLEPQVFGVLCYLVANRDRVISKEELFDAVWGNRFVSESALTSRVKNARKAVGDDGHRQRYIKTVHARGYRFVADVRTAPGTARRTLPALRSAPIGRDADIDGVVDRVHENQLVTITGSGGVGKTTLALAVAHHRQAGYADGAVFVDLSPIGPDGDLTRAVAEAAGVEGEASRSLQGVADHLAGRPVLLVLDNCEHVLDRAAQFVDRLRGGDTVHVLATSREPLRLAGEHVWPLGPLGDAGPALFVERARAAEPRMSWEPDDPRVVELCQRLDNLPLALELAAGQLRRLSLDELSRRLDHRLTLLAQRAVGESRRHATMEATIDWSYQLLDASERRLLRHLSVFPASFDINAVEASAPPLSGAPSAATLGELVDKSLVVRDPAGDRYRLLETIRVFARHHLDQEGETAEALERHRRCVVERITSASRLARGLSARRGAGYRRDHENARQAFRQSLDGGRVGDAVEIALGAAFLWRNAMGCAEGSAWVSDLLGRDLGVHNRAWVQILRADVAQGRGEYRELLAAASAANELVTSTNDPVVVYLGAHYAAFDEFTGRDQIREGLLVARRRADDAGDIRLVALAEAFLAAADLSFGNDDDASRRLEWLDRTASHTGYDRFITHWAAWMKGIAEQNAAAAQRWMRAQQDFLDRTGIVETWLSTFSTAMTNVVAGGNIRDLLGHALTLADREGNHAEADGVLVLAYAEACAGRYEKAAELMGTAVRGRFNTTAHYVLYRVALERPVGRQLDPAAMEAAIARGRQRIAVDTLAEHGITWH